MAFDYKKEQKTFYRPTVKPQIIDIPPMQFLSVERTGNPNDPDGQYSDAIGQLYGVAYTLKMSYKKGYDMEGFFEYVVPPLEGFWWMKNKKGVDYAHKEDFHWISLIRLPEFVKEKDVEWAKEQVTLKKKKDFSKVKLLSYDEGRCVQCLHLGSYDDEPQTVEKMYRYIEENGYVLDITDQRYHHEIYLTDGRKSDPTKMKTIIRHPVRQL